MFNLDKRNPAPIVASLFTLTILFVYPLFFGNDYTDIFIYKYTFYYISALIAIAFYLPFMISTMIKTMGKEKRRFSTWEIALFVFTTVCIISTLQSDFVYESFWGNEGRSNGLFLTLLCCLTTYIIGRHLKMKQWYLDLFLCSGLLVDLFGISDYFKMDLLGIRANMSGPLVWNFTSTMGNINFHTSFVALVLGCSAGLFLAEKKRYRVVSYFISYQIALAAIIMGTSDNAYLSLSAIFGFLPFYAFAKKSTTKRYLLLLSSSSVLLEIIAWINEVWAYRVVEIDSILTNLGEAKIMTGISAGLILMTILVYRKWPAGKDHDDDLPPLLRRLWVAFSGIIVLLVVYILFDANAVGHGARYGILQDYVVFNDSWGTYRGYAWRIAWEYFIGFSPLHKLFGYGLETFPILNIYNHKWEMAFVLETFYDSVHNEYLQYLISIGIVGLLSYLAWFAIAVTTMCRHLKESPYLIAIIISLAAYWTQAFVNISTVYVMSIMWVLMAVGLAACRPKES